MEIPELTYRIEDVLGKKVFKLFVGQDEIFNILMSINGVPVYSYATKVMCLHTIFQEHSELLMLFLVQMEKDGKI